MTLDNWFVSHPEKGRCEKRLYCFPFAGGTALLIGNGMAIYQACRNMCIAVPRKGKPN